MKTIFSVNVFRFPYDYKFPGQSSDERILFITRENDVMLLVRRIGIALAAAVVLTVGWWASGMIGELSRPIAEMIRFFAIIISLLFFGLGWWWTSTLWQKSVCLVTSKRLAKFIYTTPFNRHVLSLPLDMIVDTGSYTKGLVQAAFNLGTFTARSAATSSGAATDEDSDGQHGRINKKYFYIENVAAAEDLQHYVNKLLYASKNYRDHLTNFRPFLPHLKGAAREEYMKQFPQFWS